MNEIQLTGLVALHGHSLSTAMLSVPVPPVAEYVVADDDTDASQRDDVGDVTVVEVLAELPHPNAASAAQNSRGARKITRFLYAQDSPSGVPERKVSMRTAWYHRVLQRNTY